MKDDRRRVYVIRHGVTVWNEQGRIVGHEDLGLSDKGRVQAQGAKILLASCRLDVALSSPLRRTRETAEIALAGHELEPRCDPRLIELALKGWEGLNRKELRDDPNWRLWLTAPHTIATPEGEHLSDVLDRASAALSEAIADLPSDGGLAIFTHGGVARVLILHLLGMPLSAYQKLRCDCASVSGFEVSPQGELARVLALNLTEPLIALSGKPVG